MSEGFNVDAYLNAIGEASKSNRGLAAYLIASITIIWLGTRVWRYLAALKSTENISDARERNHLLVQSMGGVPLREGVSPEQFLRARVHTYIFWICLTLIAAILFISYLTADAVKSLQMSKQRGARSELRITQIKGYKTEGGRGYYLNVYFANVGAISTEKYVQGAFAASTTRLLSQEEELEAQGMAYRNAPSTFLQINADQIRPVPDDQASPGPDRIRPFFSVPDKGRTIP